MVELADVGAGQRVLDIATGIGEPALVAARLVGPAGRVIATDLSPRMLDIARERATASAVTNVEFIEKDAQQLDFHEGSFDAVLWRWGPMDLPDPSNTFVAIRRMLTPGGSFATAVWPAGPNARPLASRAMSVACVMFDLPTGDAKEPAPPDTSLRQQLIDAGFTDVRVEELTLTLEFASTDDCTRYLMDVSPEFSTLLSARSPALLAAYRHRLAAALQEYVTADGGVRIPNVTLCAAGRR